MKSYQRIIREKKAKEPSGDLFGDYWKKIDVDIKKAIVKPISNEEAKKVILEYEWLGTMGTSTRFCYGIFFDGHLGGVVCYGELGAVAFDHYRKTVGEKFYNKGIILNRGACVHWAHEHAGSKLISSSLKDINKKNFKFVVAYVDSEAGEVGTLYQATNWYYLGATKDVHHDIYYKNGKMFLGDRNFYVKFGTRSKKKMEEYIKEHAGLELRVRKGKGRYMYLLGTKKDRKEMWKVLQYKVKPYPKRGGNAG